MLKEGSMADRDEDYSDTDEGNLPRRRFSLAAAGTDKIFVAVEHGGIASGVDWFTFSLAASRWVSEGSRPIARVPASESEVRWVICNGNVPPLPVADQQNHVRRW